VNKPRFARPLADLTAGLMADAFARQGFASREIVTRWAEIAGADIAVHAQPVKIQWRRAADGEPQEPGTLVLRVEGPAAIEIQHQSGVILERVNRFCGWQAVGRLALRQAPLHRPRPKHRPTLDPAAAAREAERLADVNDAGLRQALGRLGAAVKRT
jgi:hypothetical protein